MFIEAYAVPGTVLESEETVMNKLGKISTSVKLVPSGESMQRHSEINKTGKSLLY